MIALQWRLALAGIALGASFGSGWYIASNLERKASLERELEAYGAYQDALIAARKKEQDIQAKVDQVKRDADAKVKSLNNRVAVLTSELRNRPERPTGGVPENPSTNPTQCTGAGLYRDDSEFLIRLAQDADITREALNQCKQAYEALR